MESKANSFMRHLTSVCLPTYNGEKYIKSSLDSILTQSESDFELIVLDDCSIDNTYQIVCDYEDRRIKPYRNSKRLGLVENWNACINLSEGDLVYLMHQDDVMMPDNLIIKKGILEENKDAGFVFSNILLINSSGQITGKHWMEKKLPEQDYLYAGMDFFRTLVLAGGNFVCCPTVMLRREAWNRVGKFDPRLPFTVDMEMWLRIALKYDVAYAATPLLLYRNHNMQETVRFSKMAKEITEVEKAVEIAIKESLCDTGGLDLLGQARLNLIKHSISMSKWKLKNCQLLAAVAYLCAAIGLKSKNKRDNWHLKAE